ncbi:hypothetical protein NFI96_034407 [Prochilodus magdalenae]|nr:hypothetical protein NFI96_034407 [Prochilodus magdalenae]
MRCSILCGLLFLFLGLDVCSSAIPGGWSGWKDVGQNEVDICTKIKPEVEGMTNKKFRVYEPLNYRTQIVNGVNYEFKVFVGRNQYAELKVYHQPYGQPELQKAVLVSLPDVDVQTP